MTLSSSVVTPPPGIEPRYVSALVQAALRGRIQQGPEATSAPIHLADLEPDGRKTRRVTRELADAGLVYETHDACTVRIDAVFALVTATKPNLSAAINDWNRGSILEGRAPVATALDKLTFGEQLWVLTYPHEYQFQWLGNHKEIDWKLGDAPPDGHWRMSLWISDAALRDEFAREMRTRKIAALMKQNAGWALEKVLKLDEGTVKTFMTIGRHRGLMFDDGTERFDSDYTTWAAQAEQMMAAANAQLTEAMQKVEAAAKVAQAVAKHGGWDKLGAELREKIEAHVDGRADDTADEKGAV